MSILTNNLLTNLRFFSQLALKSVFWCYRVGKKKGRKEPDKFFFSLCFLSFCLEKCHAGIKKLITSCSTFIVKGPTGVFIKRPSTLTIALDVSSKRTSFVR